MDDDYVSPDPIRSYPAKLCFVDLVKPPRHLHYLADEGFEAYEKDERTIGVRPKWISVETELPPISFLESDEEDDPYECHPVLVYSDENPGIMCVAYLEKDQDKDSWNYGDLSWSVYMPGGNLESGLEKEVFTHWMPLPNPPSKNEI